MASLSKIHSPVTQGDVDRLEARSKAADLAVAERPTRHNKDRASIAYQDWYYAREELRVSQGGKSMDELLKEQKEEARQKRADHFQMLGEMGLNPTSEDWY